MKISRPLIAAAALLGGAAFAQSGSIDQQPSSSGSMSTDHQQDSMKARQPYGTTERQQDQTGAYGGSSQAGQSALLGQEESFPSNAKAAEMQKIEAAAREYQMAWNKGDAEGVAKQFTQDGTFATIDGQKATGREEIRRVISQELSGPMKGSQFDITVSSVRMVGKDVAIVDTQVKVSGMEAKGPGGQALTDLESTAVARREGKDWKIEALRSWPQLKMPGQGVGGSGSQGKEMGPGEMGTPYPDYQSPIENPPQQQRQNIP